MNKNTVASVLREEALRRATDDELAQLLFKAAQYYDALSVDAEVAERLHSYSEKRSADLPQMINTLRAQIIELQTQMARYVHAIEGAQKEKTA